MAAGAVVAFVFGVDDALNGGAARWARFSIATVDGHFGAEGGDFFGEALGGFGIQAIGPVGEDRLRGRVELGDLFVSQATGEQDGGEFGGEEDFVAIGVADAGEETRIG